MHSNNPPPSLQPPKPQRTWSTGSRLKWTLFTAQGLKVPSDTSGPRASTEPGTMTPERTVPDTTVPTPGTPNTSLIMNCAPSARLVDLPREAGREAVGEDWRGQLDQVLTPRPKPPHQPHAHHWCLCGRRSRKVRMRSRPAPETQEVTKMGARLEVCRCLAHVMTSSMLLIWSGVWSGRARVARMQRGPRVESEHDTRRLRGLAGPLSKRGHHSSLTMKGFLRMLGCLRMVVSVSRLCFATCAGARSTLVSRRVAGG